MERVRAFDVAQEGFRLVARQPKAVFVWGMLMTLAQVVIPYGVLAWLMFSQGGLMQMAMSGESALDDRAIRAFELKMNLVQFAVMPLAMLVGVVVMAAVFRAMFEPQASDRFYLRIGSAEGWMLLVGLVACIVIGVPAVIVALIIGAAAAIVGMASKIAAICLCIVLVAAAVVAYFWVGARLMMASPLTYTAREFRLFESWPLTKGHVWFLIRVWLAMVLLLIAAGLVIGIGVLIVLGVPAVLVAIPLVQSAKDADPAIWMSQNLGTLIGLGVGFGLLYLAITSFVSGAYMAILGAPIARAFQILTGDASTPALTEPESAAVV